MKFSMFKRTPHQRFNHIPIYYSEQEERRKELVKSAEKEFVKEEEKKDEEAGDYHNRLKGSMKRYAHQHQSASAFTKSQSKRSNIRIVAILAGLFLMAYLLLRYTNTFVETFISK
jgi:hypothetical protein